MPLLATASLRGCVTVDDCNVGFLPRHRCRNKAFLRSTCACAFLFCFSAPCMPEQSASPRRADLDRPWGREEVHALVLHVSSLRDSAPRSVLQSFSGSASLKMAPSFMQQRNAAASVAARTTSCWSRTQFCEVCCERC